MTSKVLRPNLYRSSWTEKMKVPQNQHEDDWSKRHCSTLKFYKAKSGSGIVYMATSADYWRGVFKRAAEAANRQHRTGKTSNIKMFSTIRNAYFTIIIVLYRAHCCCFFYSHTHFVFTNISYETQLHWVKTGLRGGGYINSMSQWNTKGKIRWDMKCYVAIRIFYL